MKHFVIFNIGQKFSLFFVSLLIFLACERIAVPSYHTVVDAGYSGTPGKIIDNSPTFATIGEALAAVPEDNESPFIIFIRKGRYHEKLSVDKANITFLGESRDETIISYDASGDSPDPQGGTYGTWGSFTLRITAPDFRAENLTIENGFDYPANAAKLDDDPTKVQNPQAVALMTDAGSDRAVFRNCKIVGYQDTMFANAGRHYFYQCQIMGHVDFIFGAGQAVFHDCDIVSRNRRRKNPTGYVTAASTPIMYPYGFLFVDSRLVKESPEIPDGSVRLGRPWHPAADPSVSGSAVFVRCYMDDHIGPAGYARISSRDSTGKRIWFDLEAGSRFFEYASYGPGAISSPDRPTLNEKAAEWYTPDQVLNGWVPPGTD
ncbi:MAG: pectin esterase [Calditrichaeota bacterium]|nr:pectin esterase [Calditrichota bacterium]